MKFICRGDDHEDLTEKVYAAIKSVSINISEDYSTKMKINHEWRVKIKCSKGHENIFEGKLNFEGGDYTSRKIVD